MNRILFQHQALRMTSSMALILAMNHYNLMKYGAFGDVVEEDLEIEDEES